MSGDGRLYTISEVAEELQVSRETLYTWIEKGKITTVNNEQRRKQRITQETLDYLRANVVPVETRTLGLLRNNRG